MKHSQQPEVLPRQRLLSQHQPFALPSQTARPSSSRQMLPLQSQTIPTTPLSRRDRPSVSQRQAVASGGHSSSCPRAFAGTQNADLGQQESYTNTDGFPCQCQNVNDRGHTHEERSRGNIGETIRKRRGRSPRRRGVEKLELAVSPRPL